MKLYDSKVAPNPRRTRIFLAEKGITVPTEQVDMMHDAAQDAGIHGDQPAAAHAGAGARRRHRDHRIDRHLPLFRGAAAGAAAVRGGR